jgi:hypothetical protein
MPDINDEFEKKHLLNIARNSRKIRKAYEDSITELTLKIKQVHYQGNVFDLSKYPVLQKQIEAQIKKMHATIYSTVVNSIEDSWELSNLKNNILLDKRLSGRRPSEAAKKILYDPNLEARNAFIKRKEKGLDLSKRIWNILQHLGTEMEMGLGMGISEGKPAAKIATDMKKYLNDPDKLFRRVRSIKGDPNSPLKLSRAAANFHPGQGVYRSSYKNALRLTRTETNISYRLADQERWKTLPFVKGYEIKLSNAHPKYDICDRLVGIYPLDFAWGGWHPQCICYKVPVLVSDEEYDKIEDHILGLSKEEGDINKIEHPPAEFGKYVNENKDRIAGWKNKPYWVRDNQKYYNNANIITKKGKLQVDLNKLNLKEYIRRLKDPKYKGALPELTIQEKAGIHGYTDQEYWALNNYLRGLNVSAIRAEYFDNYTNLLINALDSVVKKFVGTVYRGTDLQSDSLKQFKDHYHNKTEYVENGFTSTSSSITRKFSGNTTFIIHSKTGREVDAVSHHDYEKEVLFKAKTKFKVLKYEKRSDGVTYITLEEV